MITETTAPLSLGFVGGGVNSAVGYTHFVASHLDGLFQVVSGCFSRDAGVNAATADRFGVDRERVYSDFVSMLDAESGHLDAICVLTPTPQHADMVSAALKAGIPVICEKALATSVKSAERMVDLSRENLVPLNVTFNYVGYPMVREARSLINRGAIGTLQQVIIEMPQESFSRSAASPQTWRKRDYDLPCVSLDLGVHVVHLLEFLSGGRQCEAVTAAQSSFGDIPEVIDTVHALLRLEGGVLANLSWGKATLGYRNGLCFKAFGSDGSLFWEQADPEILVRNFKTGERQLIDRGQLGLLEANENRYNRFKAGHPSGFIEAFANIYTDFHAHLTGSGDCRRHCLTGSSALTGMQILKVIHDAACV